MGGFDRYTQADEPFAAWLNVTSEMDEMETSETDKMEAGLHDGFGVTVPTNDPPRLPSAHNFAFLGFFRFRG